MRGEASAGNGEFAQFRKIHLHFYRVLRVRDPFFVRVELGKEAQAYFSV
jgi:hypothetical protein